MSVDVQQVGPEALEQYGRVPMSFTVESIFRVDVVDGGFGGLTLTEEPVAEAYVKDYDAYDEEGPTRWARRWDLSHWAFFLAGDENSPTGAAAAAMRTPGSHMLEDRDDLAVLWDIRVHPDHRRRGVGAALFDRAVEWARASGAVQLKIETQNINVPACRFYASRGCRLSAIDRDRYAGDPRVAHEIMLIWRLDL